MAGKGKNPAAQKAQKGAEEKKEETRPVAKGPPSQAYPAEVVQVQRFDEVLRGLQGEAKSLANVG